LIDVPSSGRTLPALLEHQAQALGERPYLRIGTTTRSYVGMREAAARMAGSFAAAGLGPGDRLAIMSENREEVVDSWFASAWLGAILVPVNTATRGPQLQHVLQHSGARVLVIDPSFLERLELLDELPPELELIWVLEAAGYVLKR
jgi:crotonobetaine/carnitine-CoA ligase